MQLWYNFLLQFTLNLKGFVKLILAEFATLRKISSNCWMVLVRGGTLKISEHFVFSEKMHPFYYGVCTK